MRRLDGVLKTQLNTDRPAHLDITLKPGAWIDPTKFFQQISDAGYQPRRDDVRLTLTGKITQDGDRLLFTLEDVKPGPQMFLLLAGTSKKGDESAKFTAAFAAANAAIGQTMEIEALWKPPASKKDKTALPTLTVLRVAPVKEK